MKKLNNRQNQVKSLDFSNNAQFLYNQALHKSPQLVKGIIQHNQAIQQTKTSGSAAHPLKSEINHFVKKNSGLPPSQQIQKVSVIQQLSQVESTQSFKASPVKSDIGLNKNYPQSIKKTSINKAQGLHKKAVSLMGASTAQHSNLVPESHLFDFGQSSHQASMLNSQKQSFGPSQQNSFNDYSSNNAVSYGDFRASIGPKVDNFIANEKNGSLLTAQQLLQIKNYQKMLHESQLPLTAEQLGNTQPQQRFIGLGPPLDPQQITNLTQGMKSFDQRPPMNQISGQHQSQRLSIMSATAIAESSNMNNSSSHQQQQNPAYRSHTNSFKTNNNIAMKYPPNKYVKGTPLPVQNQSSTAKTQKTLQYHHQRTFSDNPSKGHIMNNSTGVNQNTNRNFQELIRSANDQEQMGDNPALIDSQLNYPNASVTSSVQLQLQNAYNPKITLGSQRQSAQSQTHIDDRDALLQLLKNSTTHNNQQQQQHQDKFNDMKIIYSGMLKDQIQKTKQQLKLTQSQFGGPSRKVVQTKVNANTQSYRATNQNTLVSGASTKLGQLDSKATPKIYLTKSTKKSSNYKNQSHNASSHGMRGSTNTTQISNPQMLLTDKLPKKKQIYNNQFESSQSSMIASNQMNVNLSGTMVEITSGQTVLQNQPIGSLNHKRSISDGKAIFQSLNNRGQLDGNGLLSQQLKQGSKTGGMTLNNPMSDPETLAKNSQRQSATKITAVPYNVVHANKNNEYQLMSERQQFNISKTGVVIGGGPQNQNIIINSHRQIGGADLLRQQQQMLSQQQLMNQQQQLIQQQPQAHQIRSQSYQITIENDKYQIKPQVKPSHEQILPKQQREPEMVIEDQDINLRQPPLSTKQSSHQIQEQNVLNKTEPTKSLQTQLKPVEERIETQESAMSDPNLSPRTRKNMKLIRKIRLAFQKTSNPPATASDFYKIGKVMGKGAFGKVNLAIHRLSGKFVALKSINKQFLSEEASKRKLMQEFNILRRTRHRNIVRLYESFDTTQHIVFVMEVCGAGDLLTYVRRRRKLKEDVAKHLFKQIVEGLRYCHSRGILHRDIKLDNILLTSEGDIKICDFGVSKLVKAGEIMTEQCGTPAYIAPEIFENKGYEGYASDVWSAGVVLYAMLYGTVPFKASNMTELQKQIIKCQTTFKDEISAESITLLKGILERDPLKRLSIAEILRHPWMQNIQEIVSVFTDQEKEKVDQEFAYYNFKNDQNDVGEVVHTDPFTEQMLQSTQNSLVKNVSSKSVILAPFNSTKSHIDDNFHERKSIQDLMIDKKCIKFAAKVKEIDRQYEANNNAELDNGVYHQDSEEEKEEKRLEEEKLQQLEQDKLKGKKLASIETSFEKEKDKDIQSVHVQEDPDNALQKEIEDAQQMKKESEWQKLEQIVINKQKIEDEEDDKNHKSNSVYMGSSAMTIVIDDKILAEIEKSGFPRSYIISSLNNDDLNYATAFYHLLTTQKEY